MSQHTVYLDRMAERLGELERNVGEMRQRAGNDQRAAELQAGIDVQKARLAEMRRAGAELSPEMLQSFSAAVDALGGRIGREMQKAA